MNSWIEQNYNELRLICSKISKEEDIDDLFQSCIEQFLSNKKSEQIPDKEKFYFFARIVSNNFNSKTSIYHNNHRRFKFSEVDNLEIKDEIYYESPITMEWLNNEIQEMKKSDWYYARLFELYLEVGASITKLSKRTTIPINSVSRDINRVKKILKQKKDNLLK